MAKPVLGDLGRNPIVRQAAIALQAMREGKAQEGQQQFLARWLVEALCDTHRNPFDPQSTRVTDYQLGRRSVGLDLLDHLTVKIGTLPETETKP